MVERDSLDPFLEEYAYVTGVELIPIAASERPDFICEKRGRRCGLELVRAMRDPRDSSWDVVLGGDGHFDGYDAAILVQELVYKKDDKLRSPGWRYPKSTILVVQLLGSDGEELDTALEPELMDEMSGTDFKEIWIADDS